MYLNSDSSARGYLGISGSHTLEHAVNQVEREIQDPEKTHDSVEACVSAARRDERHS